VSGFQSESKLFLKQKINTESLRIMKNDYLQPGTEAVSEMSCFRNDFSEKVQCLFYYWCHCARTLFLSVTDIETDPGGCAF
jgi:hypothetical protein